MKITSYITDILKSYVYLYIDPRDCVVFYIGKGKGNRVYAHLDDSLESDKTRRIKEIQDAGKEPKIDILRYGLTDAEASLVEATAIDLLGLSHLTNKVAGYHSRSYGRIESEELIRMLRAKKVKVNHKAVLIKINRLYRSNMSDEELYEATRGIWRVGPRREKAEYGMAVYQGIVKEVFRIKKWHPAGTLTYLTRKVDITEPNTRWEFEGEIADDKIRDEYINNLVEVGGQFPVRYVNI